jgi:hypothetical protein
MDDVLVSGYEKLTDSGITVVEKKSLMEEIREEATRRILSRGEYRGVMQFIEKLSEESLIVWLEYFPKICQELSLVNHEKMKILKEISTKGKFTESYGWSEDGNWKFSYEYTPEFYFFIRNYVYTKFFDKENKPIMHQFMKRIMRGDDAIETLMWAKKIYGSNKQDNPVVYGGGRGANA